MSGFANGMMRPRIPSFRDNYATQSPMLMYISLFIELYAFDGISAFTEDDFSGAFFHLVVLKACPGCPPL